ncbi:MAG: Ig family protein, partial [Verrucomicrobiales bacterium]|nr:Ig family protein [Verrucomicrobiales bacterium]
DGAYPNGDYFMTIGAVTDGPQTNKLSMTTDIYGTTPHISNFTAAQTVNPESDFTLTWDAISGATANDFLLLRIQDTNGNKIVQTTSLPGQVGALNGLSTSYKIFRHTLMQGQTYSANLTFIKATVTSTYTGVTGVAGYAKKVNFNLKTVDVSSFMAVKGQEYSQTGTAAPVSTGFSFMLNVDGFNGTETVTNASVQLPNSQIVTLPDTSDFQFRAGYTTQAAMDTAYANGNHIFTIKTVHDGLKTATLNLTGNTYPGTIPRISNFTAAQTINAKQDFTLTWDAFSGGTVSDAIIISISDTNGNNVFKSPDLGQLGMLTGTAISVVVPGDSLQDGQSYTAQLIFVRGLFNTTAYPGVNGFEGYYHMTKCPIKTVDVHNYGILKTQGFSQTSTAAPTFFNAFLTVFADGDNASMVSATLQFPNGSTQTMPASNGFSLDLKFADKASMDAACPAGTYKILLSTIHDGSKSPSLVIPADNYPNTPHISNFAASQTIHSGGDFTLTWDALGGTVNDFVQVQISAAGQDETTFRSPSIGTVGFLNGTSNSVLITGGTLKGGRTYDVEIFAAKVTQDKVAYTGADGLAGYAKSTKLQIKTTGSLYRPVISMFEHSNNFSQFQVNGEDQQNVVVEFADRLSSPTTTWYPFQNFRLYGGYNFIFDSNAGNDQRIYRVREGN